MLDPGSFSAAVRALETINKGRSVTMPKVLVNNNQKAVLDSVLQTPYSSTNASTTVATTSFGGTPPFVRTARAKGLSRSMIVLKHALRNAAMPVVSVAAVQLGFMLGGSVVTESVFALPGVGRVLA